MHFGRAAFRSGMVRRRQLMRWGIDHCGSGSAARPTSAPRSCSPRSSSCSPACPSATSRGSPPTCWPGSCRGSTRRCSTRSAPTRTRGARRSSSAPPATSSSRCWPACSAWRAGSGPRYEVDAEGLLTGDLDGPFMYGEGKVEAMRSFAAEHEIDLGESWAYSDSASDLPMLRAVGNPVAVNPDEELGGGRQARGLARDALREARPPARRSRGRRSRRRRSAAAAPGSRLAAARGARAAPALRR